MKTLYPKTITLRITAADIREATANSRMGPEYDVCAQCAASVAIRRRKGFEDARTAGMFLVVHGRSFSTIEVMYKSPKLGDFIYAFDIERNAKPVTIKLTRQRST